MMVLRRRATYFLIAAGSDSGARRSFSGKNRASAISVLRFA
jgi:hypothetical protein